MIKSVIQNGEPGHLAAQTKESKRKKDQQQTKSNLEVQTKQDLAQLNGKKDGTKESEGEDTNDNDGPITRSLVDDTIVRPSDTS
jgi:hypothetical protein